MPVNGCGAAAAGLLGFFALGFFTYGLFWIVGILFIFVLCAIEGNRSSSQKMSTWGESSYAKKKDSEINQYAALSYAANKRANRRKAKRNQLK